jgi:hypothetical protein
MAEVQSPEPGEETYTDYEALRPEVSTGDRQNRIDDPKEARYVAARVKHAADSAVRHRVSAEAAEAKAESVPDNRIESNSQADARYHRGEEARLRQVAEDIGDSATAAYKRNREKGNHDLIDETIEDERRHGNLQ